MMDKLIFMENNCKPESLRLYMIHYLRFLIIIITSLGCLSLISCVSVVILFIMKKNLRTFVFELIFYLSISESIFAISKIISIHKLHIEFNDENQNECKKLSAGLIDRKSPLCLAQGALALYSEFATFFITVTISYALNDIMINMNKEIRKKKKWFVVISFFIPVFFTLP